MATCWTHCWRILEQMYKRISSEPTTQTKMAKANTKFYCWRYSTVKPLNSGQLRVLKNFSVIKNSLLLKCNLNKIVTFGTKCFACYSWHVHYQGCPLLGGFTVLLKDECQRNQWPMAKMASIETDEKNVVCTVTRHVVDRDVTGLTQVLRHRITKNCDVGWK